MIEKRKAKNTWLLILCGIAALLLTYAIAALDRFAVPVNHIIRMGALLGYLGVFFAALSSNFMRSLQRFFGRSFINLHHIISVTALAAMLIHAVTVALNQQSAAAFLPSFESLHDFLLLGGRPALILFIITSLTAFFRVAIGKKWKVIHWLNYIGFVLATIHAQMIGTSFRYPAVRNTAWIMTALLTAVFIWKRLQRAGGK